jgi:hypothetical protein
LGASILAVLEGKDNARLSDDQKESIERLMRYAFHYILNQFTEQLSIYRGIQDVLMVSTTKSSKGITEYVLAEDNAELLERVNRRLDELLQCFQVCFCTFVASFLRLLIFQ